MALACGEVAGIHHPDIGKSCCRQTGVLIAGGKAGANGDVDKPVAGPGEPAKKGLIFPHAYRRRGTEAATGGHVAENLLGRDGEAVCIAGSILDDREGSQGDIVPGQKGR